LSRIFIILIKFYKKAISPYLPTACRFYPTCSEYSIEAIEMHGFFKGGLMAVKRISRCHPFNKGGYDPVPGEHKHVSYKNLSNIDLSSYYKIL
jgi:uncharacterized protein